MPRLVSFSSVSCLCRSLCLSLVFGPFVPAVCRGRGRGGWVLGAGVRVDAYSTATYTRTRMLACLLLCNVVCVLSWLQDPHPPHTQPELVARIRLQGNHTAVLSSLLVCIVC